MSAKQPSLFEQGHRGDALIDYAERLARARSAEERKEIEVELARLGIPPQRVGHVFWNGKVLVEDSDLPF